MTGQTLELEPQATEARAVEFIDQHVVEIVSDSGEGAQTCGQMFADLCAHAGNGIWTVEIIPAEIEPPSRSRAGASGNRIRLGSNPVTNAGDSADVVIALNEQVLYSRIDSDALRPGTMVYVDNTWATNPSEDICAKYKEAVVDFRPGHRRSQVTFHQDWRTRGPPPLICDESSAGRQIDAGCGALPGVGHIRILVGSLGRSGKNRVAARNHHAA